MLSIQDEIAAMPEGKEQCAWKLSFAFPVGFQNNFFYRLVVEFSTDCAESPFQNMPARSKLARDLKDVFERWALF